MRALDVFYTAVCEDNVYNYDCKDSGENSCGDVGYDYDNDDLYFLSAEEVDEVFKQ